MKIYYNDYLRIVENLNNIKYEMEYDEEYDRYEFKAVYKGKKIAKLSIDVVNCAYDYDFNDVIDEDEYNDIFTSDELVKISYLEVDDEYKNKGIAKSLLQYGMDEMKKLGYNEYYLNASPMGFGGLYLDDLIGFYERFGFKVLKHQGNNAMMYYISDKSINENYSDVNKLPSFFRETKYRLPNIEEIKEFEKYDLTPQEILNGFHYSIVGRGILDGKRKQMIITAIKMLIDYYLDINNEIYKQALELAESLKSKFL